MAREIKFRAWTTTYMFADGFYGEYVPKDKMLYDICISPNGKLLFTLNADDHYEDDDAPIIMEYTGLDDKNGKNIYEGDIVRMADGTAGIIRYGEYLDNEISENVDGFEEYMNDGNLYGWHIKMADEEYRVSMFSDVGNWAEVIGNIYENPELVR